MTDQLTKRAYYLSSAAMMYGAIVVALFTVFFVFGGGLSDRLAQIITSIAIVIAPFVYFLKASHNENSERTRASRNLYDELDNTLNALDEKVHPNDFKLVDFEAEKKYYFMNRMLNHDFYDSLIFSGKINFRREYNRRLKTCSN